MQYRSEFHKELVEVKCSLIALEETMATIQEDLTIFAQKMSEQNVQMLKVVEDAKASAIAANTAKESDAAQDARLYALEDLVKTMTANVQQIADALAAKA